MNDSPTKKLLCRRRSLSVITNRKQQQQKHSDLSPSTDTNRRNITLSQILPPKQSVPIRPKSITSRSKSTLPQRTITKPLPSVNQPIPPPIASRTNIPLTTKVEQPSTPIDKDVKNQETDVIDEQITKLALETKPEKVVLPSIKNTNQISTTQHTPGLCGLTNIGNTCFMNSALQCLSNIPEFTQWAKEHKAQNKDIISVYTSLIQSMWSGKNSCTNPRDIKEIVSRSAPIFADYNQKDSHEFMNSLLNALEKTNSTSIITNLFHIHTQSQVTCLGCNFIDIIDETTTFLPLPLPRKTLSNKELLLEHLIDDYCSEDNLDGLYYCHSCLQYTQAKQKTNISSPLPRVLIIQLKRFPFDGTFQKIDTFVRYELEYKNFISKNETYQLCAVSSHVGSLAGGHYTTLAKNNVMKQWYRFNDSQITKIDSNSVVTSNAYVLVYLKSDSSIAE